MGSTACLVTAEGLILSESYAGRVLHVDPETKAIEVLASGLENPSSTLPAAGGGYYVSEFFGARIAHLWPDGHLTTVAPVLKPGPIEFDSLHRLVGVTQSGTALFRIVRGRARSLYP